MSLPRAIEAELDMIGVTIPKPPPAPKAPPAQPPWKPAFKGEDPPF